MEPPSELVTVYHIDVKRETVRPFRLGLTDVLTPR